jgi:tetratricopeptide (TPR) repeat protein
MKAIGILIVLAFATQMAQGQEFGFVPGGRGSESSEKVSGYKIATAQRVFDALLRARGDYRMQKPTLVMSQKAGDGASFNPDKIQIILDEKAYDICMSFGKDSLNALAALLSHELIHYYEKHDWKRHFAKENGDLETTRRLENLEEGLKQETQCDYLGGFMAFSVGYNTYGIMPELLKKVYSAYDLPDDLPGYPSLNDRLKMVDGAMGQLKDLLIVFETANLLTILGNYADAADYHKHILETYQSREIYNNAGVNAALAALALIEPAEMRFALPLELDPKSRLFSLKSNDLEKEARKNALLKTALDHFDRALILDENYSSAYVNKACVQTLSSEWDDAEYTIKKGKKKTTDPQIVSDFVVLEGAIAALQMDSTAAAKLWEQASKQGNPWAKMNLETLQKTPKPATGATIAAKGLEEIEQFPLADFLTTPTTDREVKVAEKIFCGIRQFKNSKLFIHYANSGKNYALVQETQASYTGRTLRNIGLGDAQDKVSTAYGKPPRTIALPNGSVWVYPEFNLFFRMTPQSKVESWGVFRKSAS